MTALCEVALAKAEHRGTVELGVPADVVVLAGAKAARAAGPGLVAAVAQIAEHGFRVPVLRLAGEHRPTLEDEHACAAARKLQRDRAASDTGADDHHVIGL